MAMATASSAPAVMREWGANTGSNINSRGSQRRANGSSLVHDSRVWARLDNLLPKTPNPAARSASSA